MRLHPCRVGPTGSRYSSFFSPAHLGSLPRAHGATTHHSNWITSMWALMVRSFFHLWRMGFRPWGLWDLPITMRGTVVISWETNSVIHGINKIKTDFVSLAWIPVPASFLLSLYKTGRHHDLLCTDAVCHRSAAGDLGSGPATIPPWSSNQPPSNPNTIAAIADQNFFLKKGGELVLLPSYSRRGVAVTQSSSSGVSLRDVEAMPTINWTLVGSGRGRLLAGRHPRAADLWSYRQSPFLSPLPVRFPPAVSHPSAHRVSPRRSPSSTPGRWVGYRRRAAPSCPTWFCSMSGVKGRYGATIDMELDDNDKG
jgi:hypothetical protein